MSENIAQTVQKVIQDLVAPDVRELKTLVGNLQTQLNHLETSLHGRIDHVETSLQQQIDQRFDAQDKKAEALSQKQDAQFRALMSAFGEFKAQSELATIRVISQLSERVAVLEARH